MSLSLTLGVYFSAGAVSAKTIQNADTRAAAAFPAFPGAVGFGVKTVGGRGGAVIFVTNLNDSGAGSLRDAVSNTGARIIVFKVSGTIPLTQHIKIDNPYITILGQTSPGGIQLQGAGIKVRTHDVIVRGLMIRPGNGVTGAPLSDRSGILIHNDKDSAQPYNIVFDHNSIEWGVDEAANTWLPVHDITFSNNIFAEGLNCAGHPNGCHSMGLLIGAGAKNITVYGNLLANNSWRNPKMDSNTSTEVINNVVYSWGAGGIIIQGSGTGASFTNIIGNFTKATSCSSGKGVLFESTDPGSKVYLDDWASATGSTTSMNSVKSLTPAFAGSGIFAMTSTQAYQYVLDNSGARNDPVDARVKGNVKNGTLPNGKCLINSQTEVGGWPTFAGTPLSDTDSDGLPDSFEQSYGEDLSPTGYAPSGYVWIEEYANSFYGAAVSAQTIPSATLTPTPVAPTATEIANMPTVVVTESLEPMSPIVTASPVPAAPTLTSEPPIAALSANSYYVSVSGNDANNGSLSAPFKTIQKCINVAVAGNACLVRAGTYNENLIINKSGTSSSPITLASYKGESVTINGGTGYTIKDSGSSNYWIIDGFTITTIGSSSTAILVTSAEWRGSTPAHWIIRNNTLLGGGVMIRGSYNLVENNIINGQHLAKDGNAWQSGIRDSWGGGGATGNASPTHHNVYRGNTIFGFSRSGIWSMGYTHDQIIENNRIYDIYDTGNMDAGQCINLDGAGTVEWRNIVRGNNISGCASVAIALENVFDTLIENNYINGTYEGISLINYGSVGCTVGGENNQYGDTDGDGHCRDANTNNIIRQNVVMNATSNAFTNYGTDGVHYLNNSAFGGRATMIFTRPEYLKYSDAIGNITTSVLPAGFRTNKNNISPVGIYTNPPSNLSPTGAALDKITTVDTFQNSVTGGWLLDFAGNPRLAGALYDIGAYELLGANIVTATPVPPTNTAVPTASPLPQSPTPAPLTATPTASPVSGLPTATATAILPTVIVTASPEPVSPTVTASPEPVSPTVTASLEPVLPTVTVTPIPAKPTVTLTSAPPTAQPVSETIYDDKDSAFVYSTGWEDKSKQDAYKGSVKLTTVNDSSVTFTFTGQSFSVLYRGGPNYGKMQVYVDGVLVDTLDEKTAKYTSQKRWNYAGQLAPGNHILKLVFVVPAKSSKANGSVDAVIVR
jgi:hypothetical protein